MVHFLLLALVFSINALNIAVIGAGISGLAAARNLSTHNLTIYEASARIGGRIYTADLMDLGAAFIHMYKDNPITTLAKEAGIETLPFDDTRLTLLDESGARLSASYYMPLAVWVLEAAQLNPLSQRSSLKEGVMRELQSGNYSTADIKIVKWLLLRVMSRTLGANPSDLSLRYITSRKWFGGMHDLWFPKGYSQITHYLSSQGQLLVHLNSKVKRIRYDTYKKKLYINGKRNESYDHVILTVPLPALEQITFDPPLAFEKLVAIQRLGRGVIQKSILMCPSNAFVAPGILMAHMGNPFLLFYSLGNNTMAGVYGGSGGSHPPNLIKAVKKLFGREFCATLPIVMHSTWLFAYTYISTQSSPHDMDTLAASFYDGHLHFAGEHTSKDYYSTVHGAYLSGLRAASEI